MTCNRCISVNPLTNKKGDNCNVCGNPSVRNFISFDTLPLVEFVPDPSVPPMRVKELLKMDPPSNGGGRSGGWQESRGQQEQVLSMGNQDEGIENDLFAQTLLERANQFSPENYKPIMVGQDVLQNMRFEEVFMQDMSHFSANMPKRYFKNMVPDVAISCCENCCRFFIQDEYEFAYMENGHCPFCKHIEKDKGSTKVFASLADMRM